MSHTPGPWIFLAAYLDGAPRIGPAKGPSIAKALPTGNSETNANARLIAAAPDLLEALKGLVADYREAMSEWGAGTDIHDKATKLADAADAAIAKAEGR